MTGAGGTTTAVEAGVPDTLPPVALDGAEGEIDAETPPVEVDGGDLDVAQDTAVVELDGSAGEALPPIDGDGSGG